MNGDISEDGDQPGERHRRPDGVSRASVEALGSLSEAFETVEQARGHLYAFHQLSGRADLLLGEAVEKLRTAGHREHADLVDSEIVGRNVIPDCWTFQIVEAYNATYYRPFADVEEQVRQKIAGGRTHLYEAEMKEERRTHGHPAHRAGP
ncbi:hypothetical protein [Streptomyces fulvorobeus]|nr:hypothetical protein [Streptomyces fulvorobeus]NYE39162.1 hypothetical protein [Streptomyces fulvorobeus]